MELYIHIYKKMFNGISIFVGYLMPNPLLQKYYFWGGDKGVHAFLKGISPKVNVATYNVTVHHISYYVAGNSLENICEKIIENNSIQ